MGLGSESKRSSNQQHKSKLLKEKAQLLQENLGLKNQRQLKVKNTIATPYGNLPGEQKQDQSHSSLVQTKSYGDCQGLPHKNKTTKEDELVKHMSNLPGYLLHIDSEENLQEKAFSVGVLDWARLEKWKHHRKHNHAITGNDMSSTSTTSSMNTNTKSSALSSAVPKDSATNKSKQNPSTCSSLNLSHKDGLPRGAKPSSQKVRHFQDIDTASKSTLDQQKTSKTYKSLGTTIPDVSLGKGEKKDLNQKITSEMGNMSSSMINHRVSPPPKEPVSVCDDGAKNRVELRQKIDVNKEDLDQKNTSELEASLSKFRDYASVLGTRKSLSAESEKTRKKENRGSEIGLSLQLSSREHKNFLLPPRSARHSFCEEPQEIYDGTLNKANWNSFSYDFLQKVRFGEQVPHSCTLPSGVEMNPETTDITSQGLEPSSNASHGSVCSNYSGISEGKSSAQDKIKSQDANFDSLKILEEEMAELVTSKSRIASPNHRFSFSLSRIGRSFSFKESSSVPQLSSNYVSVKSGPLRSDSSSLLDDTNKEKVNHYHRTRSSPLRRMLDPLLKSRGLNSFRFSDSVQPSKGSLHTSFSGPITVKESLQEEKFEPSMIQALLQLTVNGGVPLFRFVADGSNMLATKMKSLASSTKVGSDENYILSSVSEIKKKGGSWINQGNKEKNHANMYNIIGQMKISNPYPSDLTALDSCNQDLVKESVLFGVEQRKEDQASTKFIPSNELAAVVVKMHGECPSVQQDDKDITKKGFEECLAVDGCSCNSVEKTANTTVILPSGLHSLPNKGIPSPLIERWKSGGLCDCGGWDVGCKLQILCNQNSRCCKISSTCQACLNPNRLELYAQGEAQQSRPTFSLVPHKKGIYALEFSSSITALQAFFISVTAICCQKSSDLLREGNVIRETMPNGSHGIEDKMTNVLGNVPAKYAPNPPHSPVGRV